MQSLEICGMCTKTVSNKSPKSAKCCSALRAVSWKAEPYPLQTLHAENLIFIHNSLLNIERDQPGLLSSQDVRHDNDHDDITSIQILPTSSEVQSERAEYLPIKDPRSLHLGGLEGLIDRQFRLLREDNIGLLRDIIRAEIEALREPSASRVVSSKAQQNLRRFAYKDVKLMRISFDRVGGLRAHYHFVNRKQGSRSLKWRVVNGGSIKTPLL